MLSPNSPLYILQHLEINWFPVCIALWCCVTIHISVEWLRLFQTVATEILHTTGSRASAVLLMFPMPSMRLLERQRATAWGLQKSPLSASEFRKLVEVGWMEWEEEAMAMHLSVFASPSDSLSTRWPGKRSLSAQRCSSKHIQIFCRLDQKKGTILWSFELTILLKVVINLPLWLVLIWLPLPSSRHRVGYDFLWSIRGENYQNWSLLCCVQWFSAVIHAHVSSPYSWLFVLRLDLVLAFVLV